MIPGDIDLTENLDFRNVVRREIPQLPSVWNGGSIKLDNTQYNIIGTEITRQDLNDATITIYQRIFEDDSYLYLDTDINGEDIWNAVSFDNYNYTATTNTFNYSYSTLSTWTNYNSSSYKVKALQKVKKKKSRDIFGNIMLEAIDIPKIPWDLSHGYQYTRRIPWGSAEKETYIPSIAWLQKKRKLYTFEKHNWRELMDTETENDSSIKRAKILIAWLIGKSERFIKDYFEIDEEKTLSYLTNMSWIRVRDAVVD